MVKDMAQRWALHRAPIASKLKAVLAGGMALALALSMAPAAAFAAEGDDSSEGIAAQADIDIPTISVTVPTSFILGGEAGIDIQELGDVSAPSTFESRSNVPVRIKEIHCDASGLNSYFDVKSTNKATLSLLDQNVEWTPTAANNELIYDASAEDSDQFILPVSTTESTTLSLVMKDMGLKDAVIEATKKKAALRDLMKLSWTFEMVDPESLVFVEPNGKTTDSFYLEIPEDANSEQLSKHAGVYSLENVVEMANDIAKNSKASRYYPMFNAMVGDASEQYTMKVRWSYFPNGGGVVPRYYDVRVIGINHDDLSDGSGKAGLTFQLKKPLNFAFYEMDSEVRDDCNWESSTLRFEMNGPRGGIRSGIPTEQQSAFKEVFKRYAGRGGGIFRSPDKVFIASCEEFADSSLGHSAHTNDKSYIYWENKKKSPYYFESLREIGDFSWWTRSYTWDEGAMCYVFSNRDEAPFEKSNLQESCGVVPCFCL